jgi:hypothetical protein
MYLASDLKRWRRTKPRISDQLEKVENEILVQQSKPTHLQDYNIQNHLAMQHEQLLIKNEEFHRQRAKKNWANLGDRNTSYFHQSITKRTRKNRISSLQNQDGSFSTTHQQLAGTLTSYFTTIFATGENDEGNSQALTDQSDHHLAGPNHLNQDFVDYTNSMPTLQELHTLQEHAL